MVTYLLKSYNSLDLYSRTTTTTFSHVTFLVLTLINEGDSIIRLGLAKEYLNI